MAVTQHAGILDQEGASKRCCTEPLMRTTKSLPASLYAGLCLSSNNINNHARRDGVHTNMKPFLLYLWFCQWLRCEQSSEAWC